MALFRTKAVLDELIAGFPLLSSTHRKAASEQSRT